MEVIEVIEVPGMPGKLKVLLNGVQLKCISDIDCPGAALCAVNQTWQVEMNVGECMCNTWFGFEGAQCDHMGPQAQAILGIYTASVVLGLGIATWGLYLLVSYVRATLQESDRRRLVAVFCTLTLTSLGSISIALAGVLGIVSVPAFPKTFTLVTTTVGYSKRVGQLLDNATLVLVGLGYCLVVCSLMLLPLTWMDLVRTSVKFKRSNILFVVVVSGVISTATLASVLPLIILLISGNRAISAAMYVTPLSIIWSTIFAALIVFDTLAFTQVFFLKRRQRVRPSSSIYPILTRIQVAAVLLVIVGVSALLSLGILPIPASRRYYEDPHSYADWDDLVVRSARLFLLAGSAVCVWFVQAPVFNALRLKRTTSLLFQSEGSKDSDVRLLGPVRLRQEGAQTTTVLSSSTHTSKIGVAQSAIRSDNHLNQSVRASSSASEHNTRGAEKNPGSAMDLV